MVAFIFETFDWNAFTRGLSGESPELAAALAQGITNIRKTSPAYLSELPAGVRELTGRLAGLLARDEWYADFDYDQRQALDQIIAQIFRDPVGKILAVEHVGSVGDMLIEHARGSLKVVGTGNQAQFKFADRVPHDSQSELQSLGFRPFRFKDWDPREAETVNPFTSGRVVYSPSYSIHSPPQVATLLTEVERVDSKAIPEPELRDEFQTNLLDPLRDAVDQGRALSVRQDF